ncbi:hypothetical protein XMIN_2730 [Xanthomonas citri pv. mangiferaeindicae LMG 941]|nr:hypothetical protein XMIN_2730 [Xanthomonas citri pv. mangiferaeindicae LMG 941]
MAIRARPYVAIAAYARTLNAWLRRCAHAAMCVRVHRLQTIKPSSVSTEVSCADPPRW